jgi:hypothetical protein
MKTNSVRPIVFALLACALSAPTQAQYLGGIVLTPPKQSVFNQETLVPLAGLFTPTSLIDPVVSRYGLRLDLRSTPAFPGRFDAQGGQAVDIGISGVIPLYDRLTLTSRVSMVRMKPDAVNGGDWLSPDGYSSNRMGLGMQYDFSRSVGLRFEVSRQRFLRGSAFDGETDRNFTFGISLRF